MAARPITGERVEKRVRPEDGPPQIRSTTLQIIGVHQGPPEVMFYVGVELKQPDGGADTTRRLDDLDGEVNSRNMWQIDFPPYLYKHWTNSGSSSITLEKGTWRTLGDLVDILQCAGRVGHYSFGPEGR